MLRTLFDRIERETDVFERQQAGKPFLPTDKEHFKKHEFDDYCLDIERLLGCDSRSLRLDGRWEGLPTLYHASWMYVPGAGLFLDSDESGVPMTIRETPPYAMIERLTEIGAAVAEPGGGIMSRPFDGAMGTPILVELPCLLVLYIAGSSEPPESRFYTFMFNTLPSDAADQRAAITRLIAAVRVGGEKSFYALHYVAFPSEDRLQMLPAEARNRLTAIRATVEQGRHPLQGLEEPFLKAITLHFQRQWGDREAQLLLREYAQSDVAHELCHDLYDALTLLMNTRRNLRPVAPASDLRSLSAAVESVRTCFATPWLLRYRRKELDDDRGGPNPFRRELEPIWSERSPSAAEVEALFGSFDRKLLVICNGARPLDRHVKVTRRHLLDGRETGEPWIIDLGGPPDDIVVGRDYGLMPPRQWPCGYGSGAPLLDREGNRSLLFSPQAELLRNAVRAAGKADARAERLGIEVTLDVAANGSWIRGQVRNGLNRGHSMSGTDQKIPDKIMAMSHGLHAWIDQRNGYLDVSWELNLREGQGNGHAAKTGFLRHR